MDPIRAIPCPATAVRRKLVTSMHNVGDIPNEPLSMENIAKIMNKYEATVIEHNADTESPKLISKSKQDKAEWKQITEKADNHYRIADDEYQLLCDEVQTLLMDYK